MVAVALLENVRLPEKVVPPAVKVPTLTESAAREVRPEAAPAEVIRQVPEVRERAVVFSEPSVMVFPAAVRFPEVEMPWEKSP